MRQYFVFVLVLVAVAMVAFGYPQRDLMTAPNGCIFGWDDTNGIWRPFRVTSYGTTAPWQVATMTSYVVNLATNTVTKLSSVASLTQGDVFTWQAGGSLKWGSAALSSATVQASGNAMGNGDNSPFPIVYGGTGAELSWIAQSAATCSMILNVFSGWR
jgi:hypothetical protein